MPDGQPTYLKYSFCFNGCILELTCSNVCVTGHKYIIRHSKDNVERKHTALSFCVTSIRAFMQQN